MGPTDTSEKVNDSNKKDESLNFGVNNSILSFLKLLPDLTFLTKEYNEDKRFLDIIGSTLTKSASKEMVKKVTDKQEASKKSKERIDTLEYQGVHLVNDMLSKVKGKIDEEQNKKIDTLRQDIQTSLIDYADHIRQEVDKTINENNEEINKKFLKKKEDQAADNKFKNELKSDMEKVNTEIKELKKFKRLQTDTNAELKNLKDLKDLKDQLPKIYKRLGQLESSTFGSINSINEFVNTYASSIREQIVQPLLDTEKYNPQRLEDLQSKFTTMESQFRALQSSCKADFQCLASQAVEKKNQERNYPEELKATNERVDQGLLLGKLLQEENRELKRMVDNQEARSKELQPILSSILRNNQRGIPEEDLEKARTIANGERITEIQRENIFLKSRIMALESKLNIEYSDLKRKLDKFTTITSQFTSSSSSSNSSPKISCNKSTNNNNNNSNNDDNNSSSNGPPLKRQRIGDSSSYLSADNNYEAITMTLQKNIKQLDHKLQSLIDFIYQFQSTVLNPDFPSNLENHVSEIQSVLDNHYNIIQLLIDPIGASNGTSPPSSPIENEIEVRDDDKQLQAISPAMINAIKKMVDYQTELQIKPLTTRITELEHQLQNKN